MKKIIVLLIGMVFTLSCSGQEGQQGNTNVNVKEANQLVKNKEVVILDVRTPEEYAEGHLPGAQNINYYSEDFVQQLEELPRDKEYLVYCHSGGRSSKTYHLMVEDGFENVHNLEGGIRAWKFENGKIEK